MAYTIELKGGVESCEFSCISLGQLKHNGINAVMYPSNSVLDKNTPIDVKICLEICDKKDMPLFYTFSASKLKDDLLETAITLNDVVVTPNKFVLYV